MEHKNKQSLGELMLSEPMKRATKLLVSVSVFSMVFSYLSWRSHPILAFPNQLLSHALDKNYMFLICNGILVLLAKTSGRLVRSGRPGYDDDDHHIMNDDDDDLHHHAPHPHHAKLLDFSLLHKETDDLVESRLALLENAYSDDNLEDDDEDVIEEEEEEEEKHVIEEVEGSRSLMMITGDDMQEEEEEEEEEDDDEELKNGVFVEEEKKVAEERERLNKLSAEELNKKFEEFIRKMKEDIRIEAQQHHLVLVK